MKITRVLTDDGKAFTDRLFGLRKRAATRQHQFDLLCAKLGIEHRLAPPVRPQSARSSAIGPRTMASGMVERFNGRIEDVLQSHRFHSGEEHTALRPPLQQPAAAVRPEETSAHQRPQGLATSKARAVQKAEPYSRGL
jgi:hypothetical protein